MSTLDTLIWVTDVLTPGLNCLAEYPRQDVISTTYLIYCKKPTSQNSDQRNVQAFQILLFISKWLIYKARSIYSWQSQKRRRKKALHINKEEQELRLSLYLSVFVRCLGVFEWRLRENTATCVTERRKRGRSCVLWMLITIFSSDSQSQPNEARLFHVIATAHVIASGKIRGSSLPRPWMTRPQRLQKCTLPAAGPFRRWRLSCGGTCPNRWMSVTVTVDRAGSFRTAVCHSHDVAAQRRV